MIRSAPIPFGSNTAEYFREKMQAPFFAYFLKDKGAKDFPQATHVRGRRERMAAMGSVAADGAAPRCARLRSGRRDAELAP